MTREGGGRSGGALLHATLLQAAIVHCHSIEDVKEALALIQGDLKIGCAAPAEIMRAPFNVERPVRCGSARQSKDAFAGVTGVQVILIRYNGCSQIRIGQRTGRAQIICVACKLQVPIGADHPSVKGRPIKAHREWECDRAGAIIAMHAQIGNAGRDGVTGGSGGEIATR